MYMKKTVVLGANPHPDRFAYKATVSLNAHGHEVVPIGLREGVINGIKIVKGKPPLDNVDTVTLYLRAENQVQYYDYILSLKPKRIIFNPGTENNELYQMARENGIQPLEGCTLIMLAIGTY